MFAKTVKLGFISFALLIWCSLFVSAQTKCNLQFGIYEFKENGTSEQFPAWDSKIKLVNSTTNKSLKISKVGGIPTVADAIEGEYQVTVSKAGFKKTLKNFSIDCSLADSLNTVSEIVFIWKGNSKETLKMSLDGRYSVGQQFQSKPDNPVNESSVLLATPEYPKAARAVRASGKVEVQVLINELGYVISAEAISGHPLLRAASVEAAKKSKFKMTLLEGIPVKVSGIIVYNFVP